MPILPELLDLPSFDPPGNRLMLGLYNHTTPGQLAGAVGRLAIPGAADPNSLAQLSRLDGET